MKINYRKIYESVNGAIPVDSHGRTYDIHHIDGNRSNNDPSNLIALSIQEHYNIHLKQGDYAAAQKIAVKMKMPHEIVSKLASMHQRKRVEKGIHSWQTDEYKTLCSLRQKEKYMQGTHITQTKEWKDIMSFTVSGDKNPSKRMEVRKAISESHSKNWEITFPSGESVKITNMYKFCLENNLHVAALHRVARGKQKQHKGFTAREIC